MIVENGNPTPKKPRRGDVIWVWSFVRLIFQDFKQVLRTNMRLLASSILLLCASATWAQTTVSGTLLDEEQKPVSGVSVTYKAKGTVAILGFGRSDAKGGFVLAVRSDADSIQLDFSHMSYAKKSAMVANRTANHAYTLHRQVRQIKEVKVDNMPVYRRKDTINYNVDAFASKQDRVIGDVIKKLPGTEMRGGEILYQGKPIQKYMVNNLDLMEGRYGMINNNLPADAVKNV